MTFCLCIHSRRLTRYNTAHHASCPGGQKVSLSYQDHVGFQQYARALINATVVEIDHHSLSFFFSSLLLCTVRSDSRKAIKLLSDPSAPWHRHPPTGQDVWGLGRADASAPRTVPRPISFIQRESRRGEPQRCIQSILSVDRQQPCGPVSPQWKHTLTRYTLLSGSSAPPAASMDICTDAGSDQHALTVSGSPWSRTDWSWCD